MKRFEGAKSRRISLFLAAGLLVLGAASGSWAQGMPEVIGPPDPQASGGFGGSVSLSADGQRALVGSQFEGRAYIFLRTGGSWALEARLPGDGGFLSFGFVVALSADGNVAVISNPVLLGVVYIYVRSGETWTQSARLTPSSQTDFVSSLGYALAVSADGSKVLASRLGIACLYPTCGGSVFVFERNASSWSLTGTLSVPPSLSVESFGSSVALSPDGNIALIGASLSKCATGDQCGEAYVFTNSVGGWSEPVRLAPEDPQPRAAFGSSVGLAADGTTALIGAPGPLVRPGTNTGAVYAFARSGGSWAQVQKIPAVNFGDGFGFALALSGDGATALVGAPIADCTAGILCGAVYRLTRTGGLWSSPRSLIDFPAGSNGGASVALSDGSGLGMAGAPGASCSAGAACGAAYAFPAILSVAELPTLSAVGLALSALALGGIGFAMLRRSPRPAR